MIWLTWRQHRVAIGISLVLLVVLSLLFVMDAKTRLATPPQHYFMCFETLPCGIASTLLPWLPLVIGVFLGAPLLPREYEQRTHLFAWTQSTSPTRWLSIKLVMIGGAILIGFGLLSAVISWWGLQDEITFSRWQTFLIQGSIPVASALLSLMVGVMIGTFIRRTLPSMVLTLVLLLLIQVGISVGYPHLLPPSSRLLSLKPQDQLVLYQYVGSAAVYQTLQVNSAQDQLVVSYQYVEPNGNPIDLNTGYCGVKPLGLADLLYGVQPCLEKYHGRVFLTYQDFDERFWPLQLVTTALLLALTAFVTAIAYWQFRRRML